MRIRFAPFFMAVAPAVTSALLVVGLAACDGFPSTGVASLPECGGRESCPCKAQDDQKGALTVAIEKEYSVALEDKLVSKCKEGLICDAFTSTCRNKVTCDHQTCVKHQLCSNTGLQGDAECIGACEEGYAWDVKAGRCKEREHTCMPNVSGSIAAQCEQSKRLCIKPRNGKAAFCGGCISGMVEEGGECRVAKTCKEIKDGCAKLGRRCLEGGNNEDASCDPTCPDTSTPGAGNRCECPEFMALNKGTFTCEWVDRCPGFPKPPGLAKGATIPVTSCQADEYCVKAKGNVAAYCAKDCGTAAMWSPTEQQCLICPTCTGPGLTGKRLLTELQDACLCETKKDFFFTFSGSVGARPCDEDKDGWVRSTARGIIESSDAVLRQNARCVLRSITHVLLKNDPGGRYSHPSTKAIKLDAPLPLYESVRNDKQDLLFAELVTDGLDKGFGTAINTAWTAPGKAPIQAAHINSFTRLCHQPASDYNDNGIADVSEWQTMQLPGADSTVKQYTRYSYFAELFTGEFGTVEWEDILKKDKIKTVVKDGEDTSTFKGEPGPAQYPDKSHSPKLVQGVYQIAERPRKTYFKGEWYPKDEQAGTKWQECARRRDGRFGELSKKTSMDFAADMVADLELTPLVDGKPAQGDNRWAGMGHHSQFKCVHVVASPQSNVGNEVSVAKDDRFRMVKCARSEGGTKLGECKLNGERAIGQVRWASVQFKPQHTTYGKKPYYGYESPVDGTIKDNYVAGCIDECAELRRASIARKDAAQESKNNGTTTNFTALRPKWFGMCGLSSAHSTGIACKASTMGAIVCGETCGDGVNNVSPKEPVDKAEDNPSGQCDGDGDCKALEKACRTETGYPYCYSEELNGKLDGCDGVDEDCDGITDEDANTVPGTLSNASVVKKKPKQAAGAVGWKVGEKCTITKHPIADGGGDLLGPCAGANNGVVQCATDVQESANTNLKCVSIVPPPKTEVCNNVDDDCDGETDEGVTKVELLPLVVETKSTGQPQTKLKSYEIGIKCLFNTSAKPGLGVCKDSLTTQCLGGQSVCAPIAPPSKDVCNFKDDDCDGITDEGSGPTGLPGSACECEIRPVVKAKGVKDLNNGDYLPNHLKAKIEAGVFQTVGANDEITWEFKLSFTESSTGGPNLVFGLDANLWAYDNFTTLKNETSYPLDKLPPSWTVPGKWQDLKPMASLPTRVDCRQMLQDTFGAKPESQLPKAPDDKNTVVKKAALAPDLLPLPKDAKLQLSQGFKQQHVTVQGKTLTFKAKFKANPNINGRLMQLFASATSTTTLRNPYFDSNGFTPNPSVTTAMCADKTAVGLYPHNTKYRRYRYGHTKWASGTTTWNYNGGWDANTYEWRVMKDLLNANGPLYGGKCGVGSSTTVTFEGNNPATPTTPSVGAAKLLAGAIVSTMGLSTTDNFQKRPFVQLNLRIPAKIVKKTP